MKSTVYKREFEKKYFEKFDDFLSKYKLSPDWLSNDSIANIVQQSIHFYNKKMYHLFAYCIMPNHVHLILQPLENENGSFFSISKIMYSIKRFSATNSNKVLNRQGAFWHHENYDHVIRDTTDFHYQINYLLSNPDKANLVDAIEKWKYSWVVSSV
jgi:REP element-mobilizing transposase RayT